MPLVILVVDDNLGTRLSVSDYLELSGYSVITAENGQQALSMIETYHPHVLVTDINMPRMDGYELVRQVRQKPAFRLLPVVFLTERTSTEARIKGYESGGDIYLPKPFEMQELGAVIRHLVERLLAELRPTLPPKPAESTQELEPSDKIDPTQEAIGKQNAKASFALKSQALDLTKREQQVLDLLTKSKGLSTNAEIGNKLHLSPRTVEKYVSSLLRKTETGNRTELVLFALENHLVE